MTTPAVTPINGVCLCAKYSNNIGTDMTGVDVSLGGGNNLFSEFNYNHLVLTVGSGVDVSNLFHMDSALTRTILTTTLKCYQKHY